MVVRVVVVGGDAGGMSAAHQALRVARAAGRDLEVVVLERTSHTSWSACGLPYWLAGDVGDGEDLVVRTPEEHRRLGVDLRTGVEVVALDLRSRKVTTAPDGAVLPYDELVLATGARPVAPAWALTPDGGWVPGVRGLRTLDDGARWLDLLARGAGRRAAAGPPSRAVVAGGGYIGIELAEAFLRRGLEVTLVTRGEVMGSLDPDMGARVRTVMAAAGVHVVVGQEVVGLDTHPDGSVAAVRTPTGRFAADVVALGLGSVPATELAVAAGLPVGRFGGLLPDDRQQVAEGVWAAGDCCEQRERHGGRRVYVPLGTHANKQGRVAGENLAGGSARFQGVLGTAISRFAVGDAVVEVARTGPTLAQALGAGQDVATLVTESTTASGYMPEARPVAVKAMADRASRRLLALQIVGGQGSAKRIDTAASAIWTGATVDDVAAMDLSYAPPFSPVWDPVQIACRRLAERL